MPGEQETKLGTMDPLAEYRARLEQWRNEFARDQQTFVRIGNGRLALAVLALVMGVLAFGRGVISGWWLLTPLAVFIGLVVYHEKVARRQQLSARAITYYESGLARLDGKWTGTGNAGERFQDSEHIYSGDLDVFGKGSLFELISVARTAEGESRLANWLLQPASAAEVRERQAAARELCSRIQLREDLALLGEDVRAGVHAAPLAAWGSAEAIHFPSGARWLAAAVAAWNLITFAAFMSHALTLRPLLAGVLAALVLGFVLRKPAQRVLHAADTPGSDLQILALVLARLEREPFEAARLRQLSAALDIEGMPASRRISRLRHWMEFLDSSDHVLVRLIGPVLLWREQVAMGIEAWRRRTGPRVGGWIDTVAELEALSSLAALAFERPSWVYPELRQQGPWFEAEGLCHPLMNQSCVPNDVRLGEAVRLLIVSGSNMSGKSTLLRSIGLNTVLAWAGGPVAAARMSLSPLAVGASIRTMDSLQDGRSRFYAEITRLRHIVDLAADGRPALFLLDELLSGTNSHDRKIGADAIVRSLVGRGAAGLVTTHDLALTQIAATLDGRAANVHFEDHLEDGRIHFDYKMRPGVVERSNALELMRAVGLEV